MGIKNTSDTYGAIAKFFHWSIALLILGLIVVGLYMESLPSSPDKYEIYGLHKSFGLMVLWLAGLRIIWRSFNKQPTPHATHKTWERTLSKIIHFFLYVAMIGMPLTGWLMSSAGGHGVSFFGLDMPALMNKDADFGKLMNNTHRLLSYALIGAVLLHAAGALKHHFIDRDNTLIRMVGVRMKNIAPHFIILSIGFFIGVVIKFLFIS